MSNMNVFKQKCTLSQVRNKIQSRWQAFRTWQIGDCVDPAGMGNLQMGREFFRGTIGSAMPIFDGVTGQTIIQLLFRPGYMTREYLRGKRNDVLSPLPALIIFFAFLMILGGMVGVQDSNLTEDLQVARERLEADSTITNQVATQWVYGMVDMLSECYRFMNMDQFPEMVDTPAEHVLAGVEGWLRSQGVFTFLWWIVLLMLGLWTVGRKYKLTFSAAATIGAYMLCQWCIYDFVFMLFSLGTHSVPTWLVTLLAWLNMHQLLGAGWRRSLGYTIVLMLTIGLYWLLGITLFIVGLGTFAYYL